MKLLLKAAISAKSHLVLFLMTLLTLVIFTLSNQMEMLTLGVVSNTGADFFSLFQDKNDDSGAFEPRSVEFEQVKERWSEITGGEDKPLTQAGAVHYLARHNTNLVTKFMQTFRSVFRLHGSNLEAILVMLIIVAAFKAFCMFASRYTTQMLSIRISQDLRQRYFEHIQKLPMSFYHKYNIGSLSSRVAGDASQIALSINSCITNYIHTPFTILTYLLART